MKPLIEQVIKFHLITEQLKILTAPLRPKERADLKIISIASGISSLPVEGGNILYQKAIHEFNNLIICKL